MSWKNKQRNRAGRIVAMVKTSSSLPFGLRPDKIAKHDGICDACGGAHKTLLKVLGEKVCVRCAIRRL